MLLRERQNLFLIGALWSAGSVAHALPPSSESDVLKVTSYFKELSFDHKDHDDAKARMNLLSVILLLFSLFKDAKWNGTSFVVHPLRVPNHLFL